MHDKSFRKDFSMVCRLFCAALLLPIFIIGIIVNKYADKIVYSGANSINQHENNEQIWL